MNPSPNPYGPYNTDSAKPFPKTPKRKKALLLGLSVVGLAAVITVGITYQQRQINADVASTTASLTNIDHTMSVLVKTVDANGNPVPAFLDANIDTNGNCSVDADEASSGTIGETDSDAVGTLNLDYDTNYTITATAKSDTRKTTLGVAIGSGGTTSTCAKILSQPNADPIILTVK